MKKLIAAVAIAAVGFLGAGVGVASATELERNTVEVTAACSDEGGAIVTVVATVPTDFTQGDGYDTYELEVVAGPNKGGPTTLLDKFPTSAEGVVTKVFTLTDGSYDGSAFIRWVTLSGPNNEVYADGIFPSVSTDCPPPVSTPPTTTTTTTTSPSETTSTTEPTSSTEPTDPAEVVYENCTAVWDAIGRPLKSDEPGYEPKLDSNSDGIGCEEDPRGTSTAPTTTTTSDTPVAVDLVSNDGSGDLAYTGASNVGTMLGIGGLLVALGGLGLFLVRRRSQA